MQSKLDQCKSGDQNAVITRKELDSCLDELDDEHNSKEQLSQKIRSAEGNIKTLKDEKEGLQNQLNSEKSQNENLRDRIRQLEIEKTKILSEFENQRETVNKQQILTNENQNLQRSLETCRENQKIFCDSPIVGNNGLSLLKTQSEIQVCQDYGFYNEPENSILMFFDEAYDGNNETAVIIRGLPTYSYKSTDTYKIGDKDNIITSFNTNDKYSLSRACGVIYQGLIHFFGGNFGRRNQRFGFNEQRNFVTYKSPPLGFVSLECSTFIVSKSISQSGDKEVVLLCFSYHYKNNCYQFDDGELSHFADANQNHYWARLGKYKGQLITVGDRYNTNPKTEILDRTNNGEYKWTFGPNYYFTPGIIRSYSMVNVPKIGLNEEYLLLIGGKYNSDDDSRYSDKVHRYNGKWTFFGNLQNPRIAHDSVFLDGRVFIIGGSNKDNYWMKTETWDTTKSRFETKSTWPELYGWNKLSFIITDYTYP